MSLNPNQNKILLEETQYRQKVESLMGPFVGEGTITINARPDNIGWFFKWLCGLAQVVAPNYTHRFREAATIKSFSLIDYRGVATSQRTLLGCLMKSITIEAPARGVMTAELGILYSDAIIEGKATPLTMPAERPFLFHDGLVELGGSTLADVEAIRWTWENGLPDDTHEIGSRYLPSIELEGITISGDIDLKFKSWAVRKKFYGALENSTEPDNPQDEERNFQIESTFTATIPGAGTTYNFKLDMLKCALMDNPADVARRERLTQRLAFEALHHDSNIIYLHNAVESYPDAT